MTTEERTMTEERLDDIAAQLDGQATKLDDIAARLAKLEALLGDKHLAAGLEAMRFDGYAREHLGERMRQRAEKDAMFSGVGAPTEEEFAEIVANDPTLAEAAKNDKLYPVDEAPF